MKKYPLYIHIGLPDGSHEGASVTARAAGAIVDSDAPAGGLIPISGNPVATGGAGGAATPYVSPDGQYLYIANTGDTISGFSIDQVTGELTELTGSPWDCGNQPMRLVQTIGYGGDPYLFVACSDGIYAYTVGTDGTLTAVPTNPLQPSHSWAGLVAARGMLAAISYAETTPTLRTLNLNSQGLAELDECDLPAGTDAYSTLAFAPSWNYLLAANAAPAAADGTGTLTLKPLGTAGELDTATPSAAVFRPRSIVVAGENVYVGNDNTDINGPCIQSFALGDNAHGEAITELTGSPLSTSPRPLGLAASAGGEYIYAAVDQYRHILVYARDLATGALTEIPEATIYAAGVDFEGLCASDKFVYVTDYTDDTVLGYRINYAPEMILPADIMATLDAGGRATLDLPASPAASTKYSIKITDAAGRVLIASTIQMAAAPQAFAG